MANRRIVWCQYIDRMNNNRIVRMCRDGKSIKQKKGRMADENMERFITPGNLKRLNSLLACTGRKEDKKKNAVHCMFQILLIL